MTECITYCLSNVDRLAEKLLALPSCRVFALTGTLGAGKTTLAQAMLKQLGVTAAITSPTYTYVNTYGHVDGYARVHHFDLYRLDRVDEFEQMGFDEYVHDPNALVLIEWPGCIAQLLPADTCSVDIQHVDKATRCAEISVQG